MVGGPAAANGPICVALALAAMLALVMTRAYLALAWFYPVLFDYLRVFMYMRAGILTPIN
jgi:hypothetical protein